MKQASAYSVGLGGVFFIGLLISLYNDFFWGVLGCAIMLFVTFAFLGLFFYSSADDYEMADKKVQLLESNNPLYMYEQMVVLLDKEERTGEEEMNQLIMPLIVNLYIRRIAMGTKLTVLDIIAQLIEELEQSNHPVGSLICNALDEAIACFPYDEKYLNPIITSIYDSNMDVLDYAAAVRCIIRTIKDKKQKSDFIAYICESISVMKLEGEKLEETDIKIREYFN